MALTDGVPMANTDTLLYSSDGPPSVEVSVTVCGDLVICVGGLCMVRSPAEWQAGADISEMRVWTIAHSSANAMHWTVNVLARSASAALAHALEQYEHRLDGKFDVSSTPVLVASRAGARA